MPPARVTTADFRSLPQVVASCAIGKRIVGFDVFDTLLRRRVEPELVKHAVARELARRVGRTNDWQLFRHKRQQLELTLYRANEIRGHDYELDLRDLLPRWIAECGGHDAPRQLADTLLAYELELERAATLPTPGIEQALHAARKSGARLIFVSDMYLTTEMIGGLLAHHGLRSYFDAGYSSCDSLRTKHTGRLFEEILRNEKVTPRDFLFIGDNPNGDVAQPQRLGIDAIHVQDRPERARRIRLRLLEQLAQHNNHWRGGLALETIERLPMRLRAERSADYQLGLTLAPAFLAFTQYIIEQARERNLDRLFFLSREGETFLRMYRRIVRRFNLTDAPRATYLAVSRSAAFLPSLDQLDVPHLHRMLRQYTQQSLRQLLRNLSLPLQEFQPLAARHGLTDPDAPIDDPYNDRRLHAFLSDRGVQRLFTHARDNARRRLQDYLRSKGLFDVRHAGIVDIGWKGTIQDNLARAIRGRDDRPELCGLYFGLVHNADDDLPGSQKHGYMADTRRDDWAEQVIFKNGPVFEMFSSAGHGAIVGYRRLESNPSRVKPIVHASEVERSNFRQHAATVAAGIEDYFREYLAVAPLIAANANELKPIVLDRLRRYILYPTTNEARQFLRYAHSESFGVFHVSTYEFRGSWRQILLGGSPLKIPKRLIQALERSFWPEGYLKRTRVPLANVAYDWLETHYNTRQ